MDGTLAQIEEPEVGSSGYFVWAKFGDEEFLSPGPGSFYVELETALAIGVVWLFRRGADNVKRYRFDVRRRRREIARIGITVRGTPEAMLVVCREYFPRFDTKVVAPPARKWWWPPA
ncbi:hypothetical protein F6X40_35690 [Paraburkholderia sp. UCT31]|uniref:hypothetical protein n=1 Tax=Paraburkholderia sp. UCT31 TaxID=2615209 RepID=UPI001655B362|nr:hypothetical protein [Paraburkholderia sp. UCT31]MBC8741894.1 hypothetical protein [Paraburkholderia sp. UCT31]